MTHHLHKNRSVLITDRENDEGKFKVNKLVGQLHFTKQKSKGTQKKTRKYGKLQRKRDEAII